jgi:hypothetical protein
MRPPGGPMNEQPTLQLAGELGPAKPGAHAFVPLAGGHPWSAAWIQWTPLPTGCPCMLCYCRSGYGRYGPYDPLFEIGVHARWVAQHHCKSYSVSGTLLYTIHSIHSINSSCGTAVSRMDAHGCLACRMDAKPPLYHGDTFSEAAAPGPATIGQREPECTCCTSTTCRHHSSQAEPPVAPRQPLSSCRPICSPSASVMSVLPARCSMSWSTPTCPVPGADGNTSVAGLPRAAADARLGVP